MQLPFPTNSSIELSQFATAALKKIFQAEYQYKKAGVILSGIVPDATIQANLFLPHTQNCNRKLMDMIDNINFSQRDDIVKFATSGTARNWKMRQELRSPRYTTRWNELFLVK